MVCVLVNSEEPILWLIAGSQAGRRTEQGVAWIRRLRGSSERRRAIEEASRAAGTLCALAVRRLVSQKRGTTKRRCRFGGHAEQPIDSRRRRAPQARRVLRWSSPPGPRQRRLSQPNTGRLMGLYQWLSRRWGFRADICSIQFRAHALSRDNFFVTACSAARQAVAWLAANVSQSLLDAIEYVFHGRRSTSSLGICDSCCSRCAHRGWKA